MLSALKFVFNALFELHVILTDILDTHYSTNFWMVSFFLFIAVSLYLYQNEADAD